MYLKQGIALLFTLGSLAASAAGIELLSNGTVTIDDIATLEIAHYSDKWEPRSLSDPAVKTVCDGNVFRSQWDMRNGKTAQTELRVQSEHDGAVRRLEYRFSASQPIPTNSLSIQMELPVWSVFGKALTINDQAFTFPSDPGKSSTVANKTDVRKVEIPLTNGILRIEPEKPIRLHLADFRRFGKDCFALRFSFDPSNGALTQSELRVTLTFEAYTTFPIALESSANMGFTDETADDRKGGWTDQGSTNDLRMMKSGELSIPPMKFQIIDPAKNNDKSCIVLGGGGKPYFPRKVAISTGGHIIQTVSLLHALAWPPAAGDTIGKLTANYRDGRNVSVPVVAGVDVANWWAPIRLKNGLIGWQGHNTESTVGLYLSNFHIPAGEVESITLESNGKSVWMVVAAGASPQKIQFAAPVTHTIGRNAEWRMAPSQREVVKGSALDFSFLQDAPAGKYGFLQVRDGKFQFENAPSPIRFYGANICYSANYLSKEQSDELAVRLARIGYNAVRFHHFDRALVKNLPKNTTTIDKENLDRLDYLVYALKKQGLYITTDLFTDRTMRPGEFQSVPSLNNQRDYKLAAMIMPEVNENLKTLTRELFTHKNPYTGLSWAEDPAFIGISLINENTILHNINMVSPGIRKLYFDRFIEYAKGNNIATEGEAGEDNFRGFVLKVYHDFYDDMVKFMRELGVRAPLTDQNYMNTPNATEQRIRYDYVDNHIYWDHPNFIGRSWSLPAQFKNTSVVSERLWVPSALAPTRVFGKPFTVTEFDFCYPNRYRAEGAPIFGAYAALQDWDGLYRFAYSHSGPKMFGEGGIEIFDVVNDPVRVLSERIGIAFFLRGDVKRAEAVFPIAVPAEAHRNYLQRFPRPASELMFFGRIGSVIHRADGSFLPALPAESKAIYALDPELKQSKLPLLRAETPQQLFQEMQAKKLLGSAQIDANGEHVVSPTGELSGNFTSGVFVADTSRSVALVLPESEKATGAFLSARAQKNFAILSAIALDGKELKHSERILLLHLTDAKVEGDRFSSKEMTVLLARGKELVSLAQHGVAELAIRSDKANWKLHALDLSGNRIAEIPFLRENGELRFTADNFALKGQVIFGYELIRGESAE